MAAQIPEELRTFRYDTYVGKGAVVSANKRGIYAPPVGVTVKLPSAFALFEWFPTILREPLGASDTLSEATAPVKLPA